jgi:hypothetical protein
LIQDLHVRHREYRTVRSFEEVVTAFEAAVGTLEDAGVPSIVAASKDVADFEARLHKKLGPSGFTRFFTADHGEWLAFVGQPAKVRVYTSVIPSSQSRCCGTTFALASMYPRE